jgi:hypothetical protein
MAKFNRIDDYYINADAVLYIQAISSQHGGPQDSCRVHFGNGDPVRLQNHTAPEVATLRSKG